MEYPQKYTFSDEKVIEVLLYRYHTLLKADRLTKKKITCNRHVKDMLSLRCDRKDRERIMKSVANLPGIKGVLWMWTPQVL